MQDFSWHCIWETVVGCCSWLQRMMGVKVCIFNTTRPPRWFHDLSHCAISVLRWQRWSACFSLSWQQDSITAYLIYTDGRLRQKITTDPHLILKYLNTSLVMLLTHLYNRSASHSFSSIIFTCYILFFMLQKYQWNHLCVRSTTI